MGTQKATLLVVIRQNRDPRNREKGDGAGMPLY